MDNYDIVFSRLNELLANEESQAGTSAGAGVFELDEIEELRRFSADLAEAEPIVLTVS